MSIFNKRLQLIIVWCIMFPVAMSVENGKEEKWAVVPYNLTQNSLFPSFNEETRQFQFKRIKEKILIKQNWDEQGVSAVVWEAAIELTNYIIANKTMQGKRILELGAGTGLVGIACSKLGAKSTVTDLHDALPFLSKNIDLNFATNDTNAPIVRELKWGDKLHMYNPTDYDIIIGADIIYIEDTFDDLLDTMCYLCQCKTYESVATHSNGSSISRPTILLAAKMRYSREARFIAKMKRFFDVAHALTVKNTNINIYEAKPL